MMLHTPAGGQCCLKGRRVPDDDTNRPSQEYFLESSLCTVIFKLLIRKVLVALTGIEPGFPAFLYFL